LNSHKFKIIGIFALGIALTVTLGACDLNDDPDPTPDTYTITIEMLGEGEVLDEEDNVILDEDEETKEIFVEAGDTLKLYPSPAEGRIITYDGEFEFDGEEEILIIEADEDKTGKIFFTLEDKLIYNQELTFNPVNFENEERINPFKEPEIREAMNWLIDRNYIVEEFYWEELDADPRYIPASRYLDYENYSGFEDKRQELEDKYSYDKEEAEKVITDKMKDLGAENQDGSWEYNGEPVELTILIRNDDPDNRRENIGNYVADQLENIGFEVEREYGDFNELSPIWLEENPEEGKWNIYTGGWSSGGRFIEEDRPRSIIYGDDQIPFHFRGDPYYPLFEKYEPLPELSNYVNKIINREWSTLEERAEFLEEAWELALKDSFRIWIGEFIWED